MVLSLKGTHGTSKTRAAAIEVEGFDPPKNGGRAGIGVYFWSYTAEANLADALARGWWAHRSKKGDYRYEPRPEAAVIHVNIETDKGFYYDATTEAFKLQVFNATKALKDRGTGSHKDLCSFVEELIAEMERLTGIPIAVVHASVPTPMELEPQFWRQLYSMACCYVVRQTGLPKINVLRTIY